MNTNKINELTDQISKARTILNDLTAQLEAEKNKFDEEPSIEDRWKPAMCQEYFSISNGRKTSNKWEDDKVDNKFYRNYNVWKTEARAEEVFNKTKFLWLLEQLHDIICPDYKPDWENDNEEKYVIFFSFDGDKWDAISKRIVCYSFTYFDTKEHACFACKILNDMRVKPYPYGRV